MGMITSSRRINGCATSCGGMVYRCDAGFSLVEVLIALAIMGFGMLGVAIMLTSSMSSLRSSRGAGAANTILQQAIEQAQRQPWVTFWKPGGAMQAAWGAPTWFVTESTTHCGGPCPPGQVVVGTRQFSGGGPTEIVQDVYQVEWKSLQEDNGMPPNVVRVDLRVTWLDRGRSAGENREMYMTFYKYNWDQ